MIPDLTDTEFKDLGISIGQKKKVLALVSKNTSTTTTTAAEVCRRRKYCVLISNVDH